MNLTINFGKFKGTGKTNKDIAISKPGYFKFLLNAAKKYYEDDAPVWELIESELYPKEEVVKKPAAPKKRKTTDGKTEAKGSAFPSASDALAAAAATAAGAGVGGGSSTDPAQVKPPTVVPGPPTPAAPRMDDEEPADEEDQEEEEEEEPAPAPTPKGSAKRGRGARR